jgi:F-type H+-transporting ATPase subunit delta
MTDVTHPTVFDAGHQHLGTVYAKALLGSCQKAGTTDLVLSEIESLVSDVLSKLPDLQAMLSSPRIPLDVKVAMLDRAFGQRMSVTLLVFLKILCRRGRFDCIPAIAYAFRRQVNELQGRVEVLVKSAEPLSVEMLERTANRLRQVLDSDVELKVEVDPELIGGLVIRIGDTIYDGSLANRLERLREEMTSRLTQRLRSAPDRFAVAN